MPTDDLSPVVEVSLQGVLPFDRHALDLEHIHQLVMRTCAPLLVRVKDHTRAAEYEVGATERLSRSELERQVLQSLIRRDSRYRHEAELWADLMQEVKTMALSGGSPEAILSTMRQRAGDMGKE